MRNINIGARVLVEIAENCRMEGKVVNINFYREPSLWYAIDVGQYTGLKDKNGKEIYEGDICNCREYECFGKIEWNKDDASFYFLVVMEGGGFEEERLYEYAGDCEVIGNIYENPELMV